MKKYNVEGNIDFFAELYKSLDDDEKDDDNNICLITNQSLSSNFVELKLIEHDSMLIIMKTNNASNVNQSRTSTIKKY